MVPNLTGVPETMLWTLHNRAGEARRADGVLRDPDAVRIHAALDYDFRRSFGRPEPSHGVRAAVFDREVRRFAVAHPDGVVVNLGEGLETQRCRLADLGLVWITVDLPEAIAVRERFLAPDARHVHVAVSALDPAWMEAVPVDRPVLVTAQGLLMYLPPSQVGALLRMVAGRFPGQQMLFDAIPPWFSWLTCRGWGPTWHYRAPSMPWGVHPDRRESVLRGWVPDLAAVEDCAWTWPRGVLRPLLALCRRVRWMRWLLPSATLVRFGG
jgi:O-methyltransferase involved in polyketide biosynthesis